jgi:hypothetical protein
MVGVIFVRKIVGRFLLFDPFDVLSVVELRSRINDVFAVVTV